MKFKKYVPPRSDGLKRLQERLNQAEAQEKKEYYSMLGAGMVIAIIGIYSQSTFWSMASLEDPKIAWVITNTKLNQNDSSLSLNYDSIRVSNSSDKIKMYWIMQ